MSPRKVDFGNNDVAAASDKRYSLCSTEINHKAPPMNLRWLLTIMVLILLPVASGAADAPNSTKAKEESVAAELRRQLKCESLQLREGNLYCNLVYRGLVVEFAGANAPGGAIYIHSMGQNQTITSIGTRCILVIFNDADLKPEGIGAHILLRDDATFWSNHSNPIARKACQ